MLVETAAAAASVSAGHVLTKELFGDDTEPGYSTSIQISSLFGREAAIPSTVAVTLDPVVSLQIAIFSLSNGKCRAAFAVVSIFHEKVVAPSLAPPILTTVVSSLAVPSNRMRSLLVDGAAGVAEDIINRAGIR